MAVPGFQNFMLPLLKLCTDGDVHSLGEIVETLSDQLQLSEEDRSERVPSGLQTKVHNRCSWSTTYLKKSGLLQSAGRGKYRITPAGQDVLKENPSKIDMNFLERFDSFKEFKTAQPGPTATNAEDVPAGKDESLAVEEETPEEQLETAYQSLRKALAQDLAERVRTCKPSFFEALVVDLLVGMGYGGSRKDAGAAVGKSGDEGIDGIIKEDRLGLDAIYVQAKRWGDPVGRPVVQAFAGSLEGHRARKGVLITTSYFTKEAREYVSRIEKKIVLIDGETLGQYMIDYNVGVTEVATYMVKKPDADYFGED